MRLGKCGGAPPMPKDEGFFTQVVSPCRTSPPDESNGHRDRSSMAVRGSRRGNSAEIWGNKQRVRAGYRGTGGKLYPSRGAPPARTRRVKILKVTSFMADGHARTLARSRARPKPELGGKGRRCTCPAASASTSTSATRGPMFLVYAAASDRFGRAGGTKCIER